MITLLINMAILGLGYYLGWTARKIIQRDASHTDQTE